MQEGYVPSWCTACYRKGARGRGGQGSCCLWALPGWPRGAPRPSCWAARAPRLGPCLSRLPCPLPCPAGRTGEHFMKIAKAGNIHNFWWAGWRVCNRAARGRGTQEAADWGRRFRRGHAMLTAPLLPPPSAALQPPQQPVHAPGRLQLPAAASCRSRACPSAGCCPAVRRQPLALRPPRPIPAVRSRTHIRFNICPQEYLNDYGSEEAKRVGEELIERERVVGLSESAQVRAGAAQTWLASCSLLCPLLRRVVPCRRVGGGRRSPGCALLPPPPAGAGPDQAQAAEGQRGRARCGELGLLSPA